MSLLGLLAINPRNNVLSGEAPDKAEPCKLNATLPGELPTKPN